MIRSFERLRPEWLNSGPTSCLNPYVNDLKYISCFTFRYSRPCSFCSLSADPYRVLKCLFDKSKADRVKIQVGTQPLDRLQVVLMPTLGGEQCNIQIPASEFLQRAASSAERPPCSEPPTRGLKDLIAPRSIAVYELPASGR